jgi:hypothetical protein
MSPASTAPGATVNGRDEDADGEAAMRTERPEPWGFDVWDPRLTLRQQAADAQQSSGDDAPRTDQPTDADELAQGEAREPQTVGAGIGR